MQCCEGQPCKRPLVVQKRPSNAGDFGQITKEHLVLNFIGILMSMFTIPAVHGHTSEPPLEFQAGIQPLRLPWLANTSSYMRSIYKLPFNVIAEAVGFDFLFIFI